MKMISFSSTPASSESSSTRESAVGISGGDSQGILEEPLPSTSSEEEDPLAGEPHVSSGYPGLVSASCSHWHGNANQPNGSIQVVGRHMYWRRTSSKGLLKVRSGLSPGFGVKLIFAQIPLCHLLPLGPGPLCNFSDLLDTEGLITT